MKRSALRLVATAVLLAPLAANAADPSCWFLAPTPSGIRQWHPGTTIPVWVSIATTGGVQTANYNASNVAIALQTAIERWNEQTGTTIHLTYGGLTSSTSVAGAVVVVGSSGCSNYPSSAGSTPGSDGYITAGGITLVGWYPDPTTGVCTKSGGTAYTWMPQDLVDTLVHELGHTMGRNDAYNFPSSCSPKTCGINHETVMTCATGQDLTDFDRTDHQSVYGDRAASTSLHHMSLTAGVTNWSAVTVDNSGWEVAPGSGSTYQNFWTPVPLVQQPSGAEQIMLRQFRNDGTFDVDVPITSTYISRHPVSSSFSPSGSIIVAYAVDNGTGMEICHQLRDPSGVWHGEQCLVPSSTESTGCIGISRHGVSTAYDPLSGRFLIANQCNGYKVLIRSVAQPTCTNVLTCGSTYQWAISLDVAETPTMACSDYAPSTEPLWSNCRLVWAQSDVYGQPIAWRTFGLDSQNNVVINGNNRSAPGIFSDHAPSVAWFNGNFQMAVVRFGRDIDVYSLPAGASATSWTYGGRMNSSGWVSAPYLAASHQCSRYLFGTFCTDKLNLFWLAYPG